MPTADPDLARSRFIGATKRILAGLELERNRILARAADAPRLLAGTPYEIVDLTGTPDNDLDYYVFELGRLREGAKEAIRAFGRPPELVAAAKEFEAAIPRMWETRNPITHPSDDDRLDQMTWFSALVELKPDGSAEHVIDPRYQHHEAAVKFAETLLEYLRAGVRDSLRV